MAPRKMKTVQQAGSILRDIQQATIKKKALMASQKSWIHFRDADCDAVAEQFDGGTGMLGSSINCSTQHDKARTQQLLDEFVPHS
jgi:uncharacterized protein YecT (DUF1311 family)